MSVRKGIGSLVLVVMVVLLAGRAAVGAPAAGSLRLASCPPLIGASFGLNGRSRPTRYDVIIAQKISCKLARALVQAATGTKRHAGSAFTLNGYAGYKCLTTTTKTTSSGTCFTNKQPKQATRWVGTVTP